MVEGANMAGYELIRYLCCDRKRRKIYVPESGNSDIREANEEVARWELGCIGCLFKCKAVIRIDVVHD